MGGYSEKSGGTRGSSTDAASSSSTGVAAISSPSKLNRRNSSLFVFPVVGDSFRAGEEGKGERTRTTFRFLRRGTLNDIREPSIVP